MKLKAEDMRQVSKKAQAKLIEDRHQKLKEKYASLLSVLAKNIEAAAESGKISTFYNIQETAEELSISKDVVAKEVYSILAPLGFHMSKLTKKDIEVSW